MPTIILKLVKNQDILISDRVDAQDIGYIEKWYKPLSGGHDEIPGRHVQ